MTFLLPAIAGLLTGAGLIIAIGPQNTYVLAQGVRRSHVGSVIAVCAISDIVLITAGVAGLGALVAAHPHVVDGIKVLGGVYVLTLGLLAARRAFRSNDAITTNNLAEPQNISRWAAIVTAVALTWLNPHVYLDTVLTMGTVANSHGNGKWAFAIGACIASIVWFTALGHGSTRLAPLFAKPKAWRILDAFVAIVMLTMGGLLIASI